MKKALQHLPLTAYGLYGAGAALLLALGVGAFIMYGKARAELSVAQESVATMQEKLEAAESENEQLHSLLQQAAAENDAFAERVEQLALRAERPT